MASLLEYKCPCCGGALHFEVKAQSVICPYCSTEFDVETVEAFHEEQCRQDTDEMNWSDGSGETWQEGEGEDLSVYSCASCGGEVVCDATASALFCPYCQNPILVTGRLSGMLKPDYVIPFKTDRDDVNRRFSEFVKRKVLLPRAFRNECKTEEIKGMYVPFWVYDAELSVRMRFRATKVRTWSDSDFYYTETSYYSVVRAGDIAFDHVPVDGSQKMPDDMMESIEPYRFEDAEPFKPAYLTGFYADKYDVDREQAFPRANQRVRQGSESAFRDTVRGYSSVTCENSSVRLTDSKVHYTLYPVWMLHKLWKDKRYTFVMNGQTGKLAGNLPVNMVAFWIWFLCVALVATAFTLMLGYTMYEEFTAGVILGSLVIGVAIGFLVAFLLKWQLHTVSSKYGAADYYRKDSLHLAERKDIFLYRKMTRVPRVKDEGRKRR